MAEAGQFKPEEHRFGPTHWFEDIKVGQKFYINSRTQTEAMFAAFQLASGDNHPIHYDREYCKARGHRDLLAHGLQVAIQGAAGAGIFPHVIGDSLIGFLEQSSRFLKPVYCGRFFTRYLCSPSHTSSPFWLWMVSFMTMTPVVRPGLSSLTSSMG